ncbi:TauD/TfdA family dioxygenase [Nocardia sp. NPDC051052]|uniref:TauD/TfdA family dioxygenase n=1 Tax=Nocardia sp. NPDC051052 TaxID=3364322 RepID=UPI0037A5107A
MVVSVQLSNAFHCQLDEVVNSTPAFEFMQDGHLTNPIREHIRSIAATLPDIIDAAKQVERLLESPGYAVVRNLVPINIDEERGLRGVACFNALLGSPFHMMESIRLWEPLGVRFDTDSFRANGIGNNPLHIDGVNTTYPPDCLLLLCLRPDPAGGGANVIANLQTAVSKLSESEVIELQQPIFEEGKFFGIVGVGPELRPFAVLTRSEVGTWRVRVSGKMLPVMPPGRPKELITRMVELLDEGRQRVPLSAGEGLYINQYQWAHGREPLGPNQKAINEHRRRHFVQSFIRRTDLAEMPL